MQKAGQIHCHFGATINSGMAFACANNILPFTTLTIALSTLILSTSTPSANAAPLKSVATIKTAATSNSASKTKLYGHVDKLASTIHGAGLKIESLTLPTRITDVRMGSPAFYGGVIKDDTIERMQINGDVLQIAIRRAGKLYGVALKTAPDTQPTNPPNRQVSGPGSTKRTLQSQLQDWKQLSKYDIILLIDRSGSMEDPMPGYDSKWQYAESLIRDFAAESRQYAGKTLKVITFNQGLELTRSVTPTNLTHLFNRYKPQGGTILMAPLLTALDEHRREDPGSRLLIAVLTDGEPQDYEACADAIIAASQNLKSQEDLQITFLGIGENTNGANVLNYYDDGLRVKGAKFDVVDTVSSDDLHDCGLANALNTAFLRQRSGKESYGQNDLSRMLKKLQNKQTTQR
ncbi:MAG: VWA domain-containing protein [Candidatus Obscuribacter sp.]|nr:VWA domain-containing protein [Candidatus Obscuribacter sp.]MBP6592711.1 VWA domain-containing protein [Candidatus Obscuribacter sp.]MBP7577407.1 VWA domain-containing protein [Candidatus Obscuribacter sp.]